jgi:hypothetical protein
MQNRPARLPLGIGLIVKRIETLHGPCANPETPQPDARLIFGESGGAGPTVWRSRDLRSFPPTFEKALRIGGTAKSPSAPRKLPPTLTVPTMTTLTTVGDLREFVKNGPCPCNAASAITRRHVTDRLYHDHAAHGGSILCDIHTAVGPAARTGAASAAARRNCEICR